MIKKGNLYLAFLLLVVIIGMFATNNALKKEYYKIDLTDPYKNYISVESAPYSVLDISGSNGYPIHIVQKSSNDIKVLRSRLGHFKNTLQNDTLFIEFMGSNIPMERRYRSNTPAGIIIENKALANIISTNTHTRILDFSNQNMKLVLKENSLMEISNCHLNTLGIDMSNTSQIDFKTSNTVDSINLKMQQQSIAKLNNIQFKNMKHTLKDSILLVLSKDVFKQSINGIKYKL